jgi:ferric-dicitrate binding protein FerR (iron transport regulator)
LTLSHGDIVEVDATRKLMWVTGRVEFVDTTVREIVHQFNRRHEVQAEIADSAIADRRVGLAIMQVDNVDDFIDVMESRGVTVTRRGSTLTLHARSE